jgi:hypothetical protein
MDAGGRSAVLEEAGLEPDPVIEAYKKDVDRTLLRERLRRSVDERLRDLMTMQAFALELREAGRRSFG